LRLGRPTVGTVEFGDVAAFQRANVSLSESNPRRLLAVALNGLFLGLLLAQFPLSPAGPFRHRHCDHCKRFGQRCLNPLATEGGQKLIEDSFGKIIAVYVD